MSSRKSIDFLSRIGEAQTRGKIETEEAPPAESRHATTGFVGKVLVASNASLDKKLADALAKAEQSEATVEELRSQLAVGERAVKLDPARIRASAFADRHPRAFADQEFADFVEEIKATGGNREPGIVRPISGDPDFDYELATGHRRHRATLVSGLPYLCFVRALSDEELLVSMATENKGRKDLSAFERGRHYARLLAEGKFPSLRALASALNEPLGVLHRVLAFGELPEAVIGGFFDPRAIRVMWVPPLLAAFNRDPDAFGVEAQTTGSDSSVSPSDVFKRLAGISAKHSIVAGHNRVLASVRMIHDRPAIVLYKGAPEELLNKLKQVIESYHADHEGLDP